jgi:hypothetical protein
MVKEDAKIHKYFAIRFMFACDIALGRLP